MMINWQNFTPMSSTLGGVMIGIAAGLLLILLGRIAGVSGISAGILRRPSNDIIWRVAFLLGLISSSVFYAVYFSLPSIVVSRSWVTLVVAGLLVGFGSRLGSGCTSGHGICGLSRLSLRSLAATGIFMTFGFIVVFVMRHLII